MKAATEFIRYHVARGATNQLLLATTTFVPDSLDRESVAVLQEDEAAMLAVDRQEMAELLQDLVCLKHDRAAETAVRVVR